MNELMYNRVNQLGGIGRMLWLGRINLECTGKRRITSIALRPSDLQARRYLQFQGSQILNRSGFAGLHVVPQSEERFVPVKRVSRCFLISGRA